MLARRRRLPAQPSRLQKDRSHLPLWRPVQPLRPPGHVGQGARSKRLRHTGQPRTGRAAADRPVPDERQPVRRVGADGFRLGLLRRGIAGGRRHHRQGKGGEPGGRDQVGPGHLHGRPLRTLSRRLARSDRATAKELRRHAQGYDYRTVHVRAGIRQERGPRQRNPDDGRGDTRICRPTVRRKPRPRVRGVDEDVCLARPERQIGDAVPAFHRLARLCPQGRPKSARPSPPTSGTRPAARNRKTACSRPRWP